LRRALVLIVAVALLAGAFTAAVVIVHRDGEQQSILEAVQYCVDEEDGIPGCSNRADEEIRDLCAGEPVDAVKLTVVYVKSVKVYPQRETREVGRRTKTEEC
jgi:hypothetical protein